MTFYRSYHGGTQNAGAATGDFRRHFGNNPSGFVKVFNPNPNFWEFAGDDEGTRTKNALLMLEEQIIAEGSDNIGEKVLHRRPVSSAHALTHGFALVGSVHHDGADPRLRRRAHHARGVHAGRPGAVRQVRHPAALGRGHGRVREDGGDVGVPALSRRRTRHRYEREGAQQQVKKESGRRSKGDDMESERRDANFVSRRQHLSHQHGRHQRRDARVL